LFLQFSLAERDAARTLTAIPEDEFYVFTHPDICAEVKEWSTAIVAAMDRAAR
jgi:hypothetical protein